MDDVIGAIDTTDGAHPQQVDFLDEVRRVRPRELAPVTDGTKRVLTPKQRWERGERRC